MISFTIDGTTASGSSVLLSWKLGGIQGWSNIVLERILTNGESERLVAISPGVEVHIRVVTEANAIFTKTKTVAELTVNCS